MILPTTVLDPTPGVQQYLEMSAPTTYPRGETNLGNPTSKSEIVLGGTPQSATGLQLLSLEPQTCSARVVEGTRERKGARSLVLFIGMLGVRGTGGFFL